MRSRRLLPLLALLVSAPAWSVPTAPPGFMPDDGAELFNHLTTVLSVQITDFGESGAPPGGWGFGFYFASDPGTLITIFDPFDAAGSATASIDFAAGVVTDLEDGSIQSTFTGSADPIGFWLAQDTSLVYSQSSLNAGLIDPAFAFQSLAESFSYMIGFEAPDGEIISMQFVSGLTAVVPEPTILALFGMGLLLLGLSRRRRR